MGEEEKKDKLTVLNEKLLKRHPRNLKGRARLQRRINRLLEKENEHKD